MKLSEGVEDAVHAALLLAGLPNGATMPAGAVAEAYDLTGSYLLKHLKALVHAGILVSVPGPAGGYRLGRALGEISLLDVVLAIEGPAPAFRCREIRQRGPGKLEQAAYVKPCGVNRAMLRAEKAYREVLAQTKLSDIAEEYRAEADPRALAFACAFVERNQRFSGQERERTSS